MTGKASTAGTVRILERRRAVALARHYREFEGLSIREIADRLWRSPATVKAYFYDPTGEKARAVKARYVGVCRGCGAYTPICRYFLQHPQISPIIRVGEVPGSNPGAPI